MMIFTICRPVVWGGGGGGGGGGREYAEHITSLHAVTSQGLEGSASDKF